MDTVRLREHVPQDCTACPHDYISNPTIDRPRRCTLIQRRTNNHRGNQYHRINQRDRIPEELRYHKEENDETILSMDGVHCGEDSGLGSVWEANLRMPTLVQWPGKIAPNTTTMALVSSLDLVPTILSLVFGNTSIQKDSKLNQQPEDFSFDGKDISSVLLGRDDEYDSDERVLFFWRDGFLLDLAPLGPPYGRFDVVAVKVGRIKAWYWTKSAHYNLDAEVYHTPPLLFDTVADPAEAFPINFPHNDSSNYYFQLVLRLGILVEEHKKDVAASLSYPLTLLRDPRYIPCVDPSTGCRTTTQTPL
jgi:C-terminal region of aryl-sulfatase